MTRFVSAAVALALTAAPLVAGDTLADTLYKKAPLALQKLKKQDVKAFGVLKFLEADDAGQTRDTLGELGTTLAVRTQLALILANLDPQTVVIENPNRQVVSEQLFEANHLTPAGRKAFFQMKYAPSYGQEKVAADGFVVGTARRAADKSTLTLRLQLFGKDGTLTDLLDEWNVDLDPDLLGEAGESYALPPIQRKAMVSGEPVKNEIVQKLALETAKIVVAAVPPGEGQAEPTPNPALKNSPVTWEIRYNGKAQPVSGSLLPEPEEGDEVTFLITNPSPDETYAVVLLVNGENTLYRERVAVDKCRKWILDPRSETLVTGFQTGPDTAAAFKVVLPDDPAVDEVRYSENLGQFRMVVFAGKTTDEKPTKVDGGQLDDVLAIASARLNSRAAGVRPRTLKDCKVSLIQDGKDATNSRGVVVPGRDEPSKTKQVYFVPVSDQPVADITLQYFHPKK